MTAAVEGGEWSAAWPSHTLPPGKIRYPFYRRLGGPQGRSGRAENLVPTRIRSRTVQTVVSRYTDWATGPTSKNIRLIYLGENTAAIFTYAVTALIRLTKRNIFYPEDDGGLFLRGFYICPRICTVPDSEPYQEGKIMPYMVIFFVLSFSPLHGRIKRSV